MNTYYTFVNTDGISEIREKVGFFKYWINEALLVVFIKIIQLISCIIGKEADVPDKIKQLMEENK